MSDNARIIVLRTMAEIASQMTQQGDWQTEEIADEARAFAKRLKDEAQAIGAPPTPETALRAMLKSYANALPDAQVAFAMAPPSSSKQLVAKDRQNFLERAVALLGFFAGNHITSGRDVVIFNNLLRADYETRLSGARPLDAPPLEAT